VNSRQVAQVGIGLLGVWALLLAVSGFMNALLLGSVSGAPSFLTVGLPLLLMLALSYMLVFHSGQLASIIAPDVDAMTEQISTDVARTLVALVGVMLFVQTIPATVSTLLTLFVFRTDIRASSSSGGMLARRVIDSGIETALALYLIMRPDRLLDYLRRSQPIAGEGGPSAEDPGA
jgi:hypothetical protein